MNIGELKTPCYVIDEAKIEENCKILSGVMSRTGCKILLAQKAFSAFCCYPAIGKYLSGTTASGFFEARLGKEEMGKENHIFSPAYKDEEFGEIVSICDHIVFNSVRQLKKFLPKKGNASFGLRVNPQCSTQEEHAIYDPCAPGSRLGVTADQLKDFDFSCVDGLHFHTLCEQNSDALAITLKAVEEKFSEFLRAAKWVNFGGGHHITREDYDIALLEKCVTETQEKYNVDVYLEPGEAIALNAGYLITEVLDIVESDGIKNAIIDASAACHMPDVIEMPYRPPLRGSSLPNEKAYTYRLAGNTCLSGDTVGDYSFDEPLEIGSRLVFEDMAIYSMVKNNTFNGICLPSIYVMSANGETKLVKEFGYNDFKERLS